MKLYQHSARCPSALQWFLNENPDYWPFIPQKNTNEETIAIRCSSMNSNLFVYANDVPTPPKNYHFTYEQKVEIDRFFSERLYLNTPNPHLDLYRAAIIAICEFIHG